jgi:hypothetical protein
VPLDQRDGAERNFAPRSIAVSFQQPRGALRDEPRLNYLPDIIDEVPAAK